jgi:NADH:flavin oxidoreductase / NADH oxidase family
VFGVLVPSETESCAQAFLALGGQDGIGVADRATGPQRDRLFQTPHGSIAALSPPAYGLAGHVYAKDPTDGSPTPHPDVIDYYEERARRSVGLIIVGHIEVQKGHSGRWHLTTDSAVDAFRPLVDRVHQHGSKMFAQLHCGFGSPSGIPGASNPCGAATAGLRTRSSPTKSCDRHRPRSAQRYRRAKGERGYEWGEMPIRYVDEYKQEDSMWYSTKRSLHMRYASRPSFRELTASVARPCDRVRSVRSDRGGVEPRLNSGLDQDLTNWPQIGFPVFMGTNSFPTSFT